MNTSIRAAYANADQCHASTADRPLIRPEGMILPTSTRTTSQPNPMDQHQLHQARLAYWHENPDEHCVALAACYREALEAPAHRLVVTPALVTDARAWLSEQLAYVASMGFWPDFVNRESLLDETLAAFEQPKADGQPYRAIPITNLYNDDPHPVWSPLENLLFRFVHDYHHYQCGAAADFAGELAVTRHILTPEVRANDTMARFLASEIVGQAAQFVESGIYSAQVIAAGILELI
jgi:hypothetical protein